MNGACAVFMYRHLMSYISFVFVPFSRRHCLKNMKETIAHIPQGVPKQRTPEMSLLDKRQYKKSATPNNAQLMSGNTHAVIFSRFKIRSILTGSPSASEHFQCAASNCSFQTLAARCTDKTSEPFAQF